ncbi:GNAT family N-acetyltransferase [Paenibacillus aurantiacus]|uniref:GNAT family N-acetyltransferase n=1 Tax=Paenibacillus aurantiacus TaxID=1936118 RepID=A0ABV5KM06_9BACL
MSIREEPALIPLADYRDQEEIKRLLAMCVWPDEASVERAWTRYREEGCALLGRIDESGLVGLIGIREERLGEYELLHLAVSPNERSRGIGSGMITEWMQTRQAAQLTAETDAEAVHFYEKAGFRIISLGEKYPGVERFRCVLRKCEPYCVG